MLNLSTIPVAANALKFVVDTSQPGSQDLAWIGFVIVLVAVVARLLARRRSD